jgi:hypothetical protein
MDGKVARGDKARAGAEDCPAGAAGRLFIGGRNLYFAMKIFHSPVGDR